MNKKITLKSAYGKISLVLIFLITVFAAVCFGGAELSIAELIGGILRKEGFETESLIIYNVRLPRLCGAMLAGAGLSVSGVLLQTVTGNQLASPNIIGVNSGAGLGVIAVMLIAPSFIYAIPVVAFVGAFVTSLLIMATSSKFGTAGGGIILAGIGVTTFINAIISFITYLDNDILPSYNSFSVGGLSGIAGEMLIVPSVCIAGAILISLFIADKTDTLTLGEDMALSLGTDVKKLRLLCLMLSSVCAASVVSFAGLLGFVGLVVPHIARRIAGNKTKQLIRTSVFIGAELMLVADVLGRVLAAPSEIPVGIVMAFIGAPFFFYLLWRKSYVKI